MIPLRRLLLREGLFIVAVTAAAGGISGWWGARVLVRAQAERLAETGIQGVRERLEENFQEAIRAGEGLARLWRLGLLPRPGTLECERHLLVELQGRASLCNLTLVAMDGSASAANVPESEHPEVWLTRGTLGAPPRTATVLRRWAPGDLEKVRISPDPAAPPDWRERPWVRQALDRSTGSWTPAYPFLGTVGYGVTYTVPAFRDAVPVGVAGVDLLLGDLNPWVQRVRPTQGTRLALLDEQGRMLVAPAASEPEGRAMDPIPLDPRQQPLLGAARALDPAAGWSRVRVSGAAFLLRRVVLERPGVPPWELLAAIPEADLLVTSRWAALLAAGLGMVSLGLLAWRLGRVGIRVTRPLESLAAASRDLAQGGRLHPASSRILEVQELSKALEEASGILAEQAQLQERLRLAQRRELAAAMAAGVAHDLGNLLSAVGLQLEMARETGEPQYLESAEEALRRSVGFIRALLSVGRPSETLREPLDLNDPVRRATLLLAPVLGSRVELRLDLAPGPLWIRGDALQLEQVLLNLAMNARDAMPEGGRLCLETRSGAEGPLLRVSDTGVGMSAEVQAQLFQPFFTTKARGSGSGLGLAMVQGIAEAHEARLEVESAPGRGTAFTLRFPPGEAVG